MEPPPRPYEDDAFPGLGSTFGPYRVDSILGRGGMGIVFRATDERLGRAVALKVLTPVLATDPGFRERFRRESRLAASLDHPAILSIYEADTIGSTMYIAMRLVSGGDLAGAIRRDAPLSLARTLGIASQIAGALDAAHARGLVHRDVKAANVLLERRGGEERAYLADFGLSRRLGSSTSLGGDTRIAGTPGTMAPEQITGAPPDAAADQYALACVVFQCLTGSLPFVGPTEAASLYAHVHAPVPSVGPATGAPTTASVRAIDAVMGRALAKRGVDRWPDCQRFIDALRDAAGPANARRPPTEGSPGRLARSASGRRLAALLLVVAGGIGLLGLGAIVLDRLAAAPSARPSTGTAASTAGRPTGEAAGSGGTFPSRVGPSAPTAAVVPPPQELPGVIVFAGRNRPKDDLDLYSVHPDGSGLTRLTREAIDESMPAVSPDGRLLVYAAGVVGSRELWIRDMGLGSSERLAAFAGDVADPAWAPDGSSIAFTRWVDGQADLWVQPIDESGGPSSEAWPLVTHPAQDSQPSWSPDGSMIAFVSDRGGAPAIHRVPFDEPNVVTSLDLEGVDRWPRWLPDGRMLLTRERGHDHDIMVVDDRTGPPVARRLTRSPLDDWGASPSLDGSALVYVSGQLLPGDSTGMLFLMSLDERIPIPLTGDRMGARDPTWASLDGSIGTP